MGRSDNGNETNYIDQISMKTFVMSKRTRNISLKFKCSPKNCDKFVFFNLINLLYFIDLRVNAPNLLRDCTVLFSKEIILCRSVRNYVVFRVVLNGRRGGRTNCKKIFLKFRRWLEPPPPPSLAGRKRALDDSHRRRGREKGTDIWHEKRDGGGGTAARWLRALFPRTHHRDRGRV